MEHLHRPPCRQNGPNRASGGPGSLPLAPSVVFRHADEGAAAGDAGEAESGDEGPSPSGGVTARMVERVVQRTVDDGAAPGAGPAGDGASVAGSVASATRKGGAAMAGPSARRRPHANAAPPPKSRTY